MKKVLSGLMLAALLATSILFVNCSEDDSEDYSINKKSASTTESESVLIARCLKGSDAIELSFDVDTVARQTEREVESKLLKGIVVEEISILDYEPGNIDNEGGIVFSVFVPSEGASYKMYAPLRKYNDNDGSILYVAAGDIKIDVLCKGVNCDGCELIIKKRKPVGCTKCRNAEGVCESNVNASYLWGQQALSILCDVISVNVDKVF
ncbi:MAG TPA: hypothetical protein IAC47_06295 [Candidatus Onthomorpha intestinigallinarum]|uniref:Lipoprotein n=1 Tax=Candidatus Onthomorpha intestinigallinarum TaxID=2840880 RepID=A0A9D1RJR0_9BACT|nr:hypothetical protein [Candidatus Onthomorpha intestinigallinarum]